MSRKGLFADVTPGRAAGAAGAPAPSPSVKHFGAALGQMRERASRANEMEKALASGERVVEIDAGLIDPSPIPDRLQGAAGVEAELRASLEASGQRVPVLLRRRVDQPGRYLTVYGHRRIAALRDLGRAVRAIVVEMDDEEAYLAQGLENSARRDLSFIERALYARRLAEAGAAQSKIAEALHTAQPNIATMIGLARRLPEALVVAIGACPGVGRRRWERIDALLAEDRGRAKVWRAALAQDGFAALDGDARFERVAAALEQAAAQPAGQGGAPTRRPLIDRDGSAFATLEHLGGGAARIKLARDEAVRDDGAAFADWLADRLPDLREAWRRGD